MRPTRWIVVLGLMSSLAACAWMYPTVSPIPARAYPASAGAQAPALLVLLPGRGNTLDEFDQHGIVTVARAHDKALDIVTVDAHLGYYLNETVVQRVWTDIIAPARAKGYQRIWIAGISMGGLGAVAIARQHSDAIDGLILLAPYLGPKSLIEKMTAQGGAARWTPDDPDDPYQQLWIWLRQHAPKAEGQGPRVMLGFGNGDRLAAGHHLLAALLPPKQVLEIPGGHDWPTWQALWQRQWAGHPRI
jgi:pimeloyl-ACP methyl ester carboxylesterase